MIGIILNVILLFTIFILYDEYLDAPWIGTGLNILHPIAIIASTMMYGGIIVKGILEYKSGIKATKRDLIIILTALLIVSIYYIIKFYWNR